MKTTTTYQNVRWIPLRKANAFVIKHHEHLFDRQGAIFSLGLFEGDDMVGVAICGRPSAAPLDGGITMEVYRCCLPRATKVRNGCSILYSACARIAQEMGCTSIITYTLDGERGSSLIATGWKCVDDNCGGRGVLTGNRKNRIPKNQNRLFIEEKECPDGPKKRWEKALSPKSKIIAHESPTTNQ